MGGGAYVLLFIFLTLFNIHVPIIVFAACILSVFGLVLSKQQKWWAELFLISAYILLMIYFFDAGLYGNMLRYMIYILLCFWTIFQWTRRNKITQKFIKPSSLSIFWKIMLVISMAAIMLVTINDGIVVMLDFGILFAAVAGKLLLSWKKADGWLVWLLSDIMGLALFIITGSLFLAGRSVVHFSINSSAFIKWRKEIKKNSL